MALLLLGIFVPLEFADAAWWNPADKLMGIVIALPSLALLYVLQFVLLVSSFLVWIAGFLLVTIVNLDIPLTHCPIDPRTMLETDCIVNAGWRIMRDIVNMLLIVVLVVIAFATMLRLEGYGIRKALMPLVAVALLVNFSKVLVGVAVDIPTIIMQIFLSEVTGVGVFTDSLKQQTDLIVDYFSNFKFLSLTGNITVILKTIVLIIVNVAFAFLLGLFTLIFLMRYAALWILTILSPLAMAAYILPATKKFYTWWIGQLVSWSLIGMTAGFFLWLGRLFMGHLDVYQPALKAASAGISESNPLSDFVVELLPYALLLFFLSAGFALTLQTSAMGSGMVINAGKKLGAQAKGWATDKAKDGGKFAGKVGWRLSKKGARVGAGRAGSAAAVLSRRAARTKAGQKVGRQTYGRIPSAWRPGHAAREFDKDPQRLAAAAGITGVGRGRLFKNLTPKQQQKLTEHTRSRTANAAAKLLGGGKKLGKNLAKKAYNQMLPEEQEAIQGAVGLGNLKFEK